MLRQKEVESMKRKCITRIMISGDFFFFLSASMFTKRFTLYLFFTSPKSSSANLMPFNFNRLGG